MMGRIVLPVELRRTLDIEIKDPIAIYVDEEYIILNKYNPSCVLCGSMKDIEVYKGKNICKKCICEF